MANLKESSDYIVDFIEKIISEKTTLERYIHWSILSNSKQKTLISVAKSSAVTEFFSKKYDSVIIYINEDIFDMLQPDKPEDPDYRALVIEDALAQIECSTNDNGDLKISINKPEICITGDGFSKFGDKLAHAAEAASLAYKQIKERERNEKEMEKARKAEEKALRKASKHGK